MDSDSNHPDAVDEEHQALGNRDEEVQKVTHEEDNKQEFPSSSFLSQSKARTPSPVRTLPPLQGMSQHEPRVSSPLKSRPQSTSSSQIVTQTSTTVTTASDWFDKVEREVNPGRDGSRPIDDFRKVVYSLRISEKSTVGSNDSRHYPLRVLKPEEKDSTTLATPSNSLVSPLFHVDTRIDIPTSRLKSTSLERGYYELYGVLRNVPQDLPAMVAKCDEFLASCCDGRGEIRHALWKQQGDLCNLTVRVFESVAKGKESSGRTQGVALTLVEENGQTRELRIADKEYLNFTGPARLTFQPTVLTCTPGYKKIVYTCRHIFLKASSAKVVGGISVASSSKHRDASYDNLIELINAMMLGGVSADAIINHLRSVDLKGERHTMPPRRSMPMEYEEESDEEEKEEHRRRSEHKPHQQSGSYRDPPAFNPLSLPKPTQRFSYR
jgi:hypothetical protein